MNNWYWIELIGFDRDAEDYGVEHFFEVTSSKIEGISLLFADVDFVNLHNGITGKKLRPGDCSYGAQDCSEERARQEWTDTDLKGLVTKLHEKGIKVTFAFFNMFCLGNSDSADFAMEHKELWDLNREGDKTKSINMLKHLSDGSLYEDFLFAQINRIISDYGFDGVHLADGISSFRPTVQNGDFSDDLVGQFLKVFPDIKLSDKAEDKDAYIFRRKKIIEEHYYEYLTFLSDRWGAFYDKLYKQIKGLVIFNQAWTCNPFEALYRYGIDYGKIQSEKAYGMMLEDVFPNMPIYSKRDNGWYESTEEDCVGYHYKSMLMQMSTKAYLPQTNLISLAPVKDTTEQWDAIRHNPMELSKNIIRRKNTYVYKNGYTPCVSAPVFCLSNGIPKHDWEWIHKQFDDADRGAIKNVCGYTALFSKDSIYEELKRYIKDRAYSSFELQYQLLLSGLDIGCMAGISQISEFKTPVLVTNFSLLPPDEQRLVLKSSAPMVIMSEAPIDSDGYKFEAHYHFALRNILPYDGIDADISLLKEHSSFRKETNTEDDLGGLWTCPLRYSGFDREYFSVLSDILSKSIGITPSPDGAHVTRYYLGDNRYRYFLSNDTHKYLLPEIQCKGKIKSAVSVLKYSGYKVRVDKNIFTDRIPPRGICIVETEETNN